MQELTKHIFKALAHTGQRAIIGKGWAGLGKMKDEPTPPHVLLVDSVPHDWLFPRCSAVIHHGAHANLDLPYHNAWPHESSHAGVCSSALVLSFLLAGLLGCVLLSAIRTRLHLEVSRHRLLPHICRWCWNHSCWAARSLPNHSGSLLWGSALLGRDLPAGRRWTQAHSH